MGEIAVAVMIGAAAGELLAKIIIYFWRKAGLPDIFPLSDHLRRRRREPSDR